MIHYQELKQTCGDLHCETGEALLQLVKLNHSNHDANRNQCAKLLLETGNPVDFLKAIRAQIR